MTIGPHHSGHKIECFYLTKWLRQYEITEVDATGNNLQSQNRIEYCTQHNFVHLSAVHYLAA